MTPSLKELTAKDAEKQRQQLQQSVSQLDAQINTLNNKWDELEKFVKKWWPVALAIFTIIAGIFGICFSLISGYNELDKKSDAIKREQAIIEMIKGSK